MNCSFHKLTHVFKKYHRKAIKLNILLELNNLDPSNADNITLLSKDCR